MCKMRKLCGRKKHCSVIIQSLVVTRSSSCSSGAASTTNLNSPKAAKASMTSPCLPSLSTKKSKKSKNFGKATRVKQQDNQQDGGGKIDCH